MNRVWLVGAFMLATTGGVAAQETAQTQDQVATAEAADRQEADAQTTASRQLAEDDGLDPTLFWVGATLTVGTAAAATVFGLQAQSKRDDAEAIDPRLSRDAQIEEIQTASRTADILFGTAVAFGVATVIAAVFTDWGDDGSEPSHVSVAPALGPTAIGVTIEGAM